MKLLFLLPLGLVAQEAVAPDISVEDEATAQLAKVRRIYVDLLTGGESALKMRDLLIGSLQATKLFIITEEEDKADAVLKGSGHDVAFTDSYSSTEGLNARTNLSLPMPTDNSTNARYSNRTDSGLSIGENESRRSEERKHEALATVRLVSTDGDVIWSTTQESFGGKFLGASADVADKVARKLAMEVRKARRASTQAQEKMTQEK